MKQLIISILLGVTWIIQAQVPGLEDYNQKWYTQSKNSSESMPLGGGDIGLNVWVENNDIFFYLSKSGTFDEHNTLLKLGRVKVHLDPNPFKNKGGFKQELFLRDGYISISQGETLVNLWVDVYQPIIHVDVKSDTPIATSISYESWRYKNRRTVGKENNANSYKWAPQGPIQTYADSISFRDNRIEFFHHNQERTVFDVAVKQQKLEGVKDSLFNPLKYLIFGGTISGDGFRPVGTYIGKYSNTDFKGYTLKSIKASRAHHVQISLHTQQTNDIKTWRAVLNQLEAQSNRNHKTSITWWNQFWDRSFIYTGNLKQNNQDTLYQLGQNYQLFRFMLGANAYGKYPTKFNGGLFTFDPVLTDTLATYTPDFRNWGGGTMTAQNQRLVYWPMLKSGDFDMLDAQLDYYLSLQKNAELRSKVYWAHSGAAFTEQLENFGLPNPAEYGWERPKDFDPGMQYNAWLEYEWDTVFEFCDMMLSLKAYNHQEIKKYTQFILSCIQFFDEHYQYIARKRGRKALNDKGHLILYPGSAAETYKMTYNANSTIAALKTIVNKLKVYGNTILDAKTQEYLMEVESRIPPLNYRIQQGYKTLAPAQSWERINNTEAPQLYPVYPWKIFKIGSSDLNIAQNTFFYDEEVVRFRDYKGWKQDLIFAARLGLTQEAAALTSKKLANSGRRFPAFWGPGFDWVPDHNWGGSGMIGLQEMLLQTNENKIFLFPAWPKHWDVHFKLHCDNATTVEAKLVNGEMEFLKVTPSERAKDVISLLKYSNTDKLNIH